MCSGLTVYAKLTEHSRGSINGRYFLAPKWQPTPVFLPGESQGQQSLVGWRLWGRTESDTTEAIQLQQQQRVMQIAYPLDGRVTL